MSDIETRERAVNKRRVVCEGKLVRKREGRDMGGRERGNREREIIVSGKKEWREKGIEKKKKKN